MIRALLSAVVSSGGMRCTLAAGCALGLVGFEGLLTGAVRAQEEPARKKPAASARNKKKAEEQPKSEQKEKEQDPYAVPEGDAKELQAFIDKLSSARVRSVEDAQKRFTALAEAADKLDRAVADVIAEGKDVTYDLKLNRNDPTSVGTQEMAEAICRKMR